MLETPKTQITSVIDKTENATTLQVTHTRRPFMFLSAGDEINFSSPTRSRAT